MVEIYERRRLWALCNEVIEERNRQDDKWHNQSHSIWKWMAILGEEVGEVCKAALENDADGFRKELIQVAAVALAIIEAGE